ncbi:transcriptional regulator [Pseudomonas aeruginosa]|uniref:TetR/AcrR family transcriptional regulator n=1 Tax=Pseudomonas aeruginosa TaxID=287 RepID=UPI000E6A3176|nr:TetR/AcrR family transcriptional regulator [Pseudomonas aeruginosa]RIZ35923.1 transcriptional regulator [Pseudomonas aeruginosa]
MDEALDKAVRVFCERGYHATSITDLASAMELASGSIYKAFKDKRAVFVAAFDHYKAVRDAQLRETIQRGANGRERLRNALDFFAASSYGAQGKLGCLVVSGASELATFDAEIAQRVTGSLERSETMLRELLRQGQNDGSIPSTLDSQATARLMLCVLQGMRVIGKSGRSKKDMQAVADAAMKLLD